MMFWDTKLSETSATGSPAARAGDCSVVSVCSVAEKMGFSVGKYMNAKLCFVDYERGGLSGVQTFTDTFMRHFSKYSGFRRISIPQECHSESPQDEGAEGDKSEGVEPETHLDKLSPSVLRLGIGYARRVLRECRLLRQQELSHKDRLVVVNEFGCETLPIAVRLVAPRAKIIAIAHTHPGVDAGARHPVRRFTEKVCALVCSEVVSNSRANLGLWRKRLKSRMPLSRVVHYGLPVPEQNIPTNYPAKIPGVVDVVSVSRMVRWKGHQELIRSWAKISADVPVRLIVVGDGPERVPCEQLALSLGIADRVLFLGAQDHGADYFWNADIAIHTPIESEAFGLVVLEAMSRGVPVVASRIGGIPEFVDDNCGMLIEPVDFDAVAAAVTRLAGDRTLRTKMGQAGRSRFLADFTEDVMLKKYSEIIEGEDGEGMRAET